MCGRFTLDTNESDLAQQFAVEVNESISSRYNIAPSQPILTIKQDEASRRSLAKMQWGLVPNWVKDLDSWKSNLINARAETVMEKPSFRGAFKHRPCLIPVSGFYEWTKDKQPYYFQVQEGQLFALAGLWELWSHGEDELITCTIITTKANTEAAKVHHRMPVIIQPQNYDSWLGELDDRKQLLDALPEVNLELYPVSKTVNSPKNDTPECIKPIF
jgi:putative SOS response-associated peptidase YedK